MHLDGRRYTVVVPRLGMDCRFSTNYFHCTWHVLSDWHGARLLGRLPAAAAERAAGRDGAVAHARPRRRVGRSGRGGAPAAPVPVDGFSNYRSRVSAARVARREVRNEVPATMPPADLNPLIWVRGTAVRQRTGKYLSKVGTQLAG